MMMTWLCSWVSKSSLFVEANNSYRDNGNKLDFG